MSSATISRFRSDSGTSPLTIRCANPSTIAVLPTPGSPISTGIVLGAAREHLHDPAHLFVPPDDRIEFPAPRLLGEVAGIALERLILLLGTLVGDAVRAAHLLERTAEIVGGHVAARSAAREPWSPSPPTIARSRCSVET